MTPEMLLARVGAQSIAPAEPVGGSRPEWTLVEAAWGCNNLADPYHAAFRYRFARDGSVYGRLFSKLLHAVERLAWRERWKQQIGGRPYVAQIVQYTLAEEWMSYLDRQRLLAYLMGAWPDGLYERELAEKQRAAGMILDRWCSAAHEHISYRIQTEEPEEFDTPAWPV